MKTKTIKLVIDITTKHDSGMEIPEIKSVIEEALQDLYDSNSTQVLFDIQEVSDEK